MVVNVLYMTALAKAFVDLWVALEMNILHILTRRPCELERAVLAMKSLQYLREQVTVDSSCSQKILNPASLSTCLIVLYYYVRGPRSELSNGYSGGCSRSIERGIVPYRAPQVEATRLKHVGGGILVNYE